MRSRPWLTKVFTALVALLLSCGMVSLALGAGPTCALPNGYNSNGSDDHDASDASDASDVCDQHDLDDAMFPELAKLASTAVRFLLPHSTVGRAAPPLRAAPAASPRLRPPAQLVFSVRRQL